jgi:flagellar basal-body rod protein FlgG
MMRALWSAASGMRAQQTNLDVTSNNLANVNTTGFKKFRAEFQDLHYQTLKVAGSPTGVGFSAPEGVQVGMGTRVAATQRFFSQGDFMHTDHPYDLTIEGQGFFKIAMPDNTFAYTRDGSFKIDSNGQMVTADGNLLDPNIVISPEATNVTIGPDGNVTQTLNGTQAQIGQITLARFINPAGMDSVGKNLFRATLASGTEVVGQPGQQGLGQIGQGVLERSNVNVAEEMVNMIVAMRAYESSSKAIQTSDEMLQIANQSRR